MLEIERNVVKGIDELILSGLKARLEVTKDKVSMLPDDEIKEILDKINEKKDMIFLLFQGDFSINERKIEEKMGLWKTDLGIYDKIANNIILKRLDTIIQKIENSNPEDGRLISVCLDRQLFIQKVLQQNLSRNFASKYIEQEKIER